ncbi:MAG: cell division protein FtsA [Bradymonadales bacterium]
MALRHNEILVGLDVGSTKISAIVGELCSDGVNIIGIGNHASKGVSKGMLVNIDAAAEVIQKAIEDAEVMSGCDISNVLMSITGGHIKGINSEGLAGVKQQEVDDADIAQAIESAKAVAIPNDREFLHVLPQEYILDGHTGIANPKGMAGVRLETRVHIVTGSVSCAQNLVKCANRCKLEVSDIIFSGLASSEAVLSPDEKELGCAVIDLGGGCTDIAVWAKGSIVHTASLSLGANLLTTDIGAGLHIPLAEAERLKLNSGCAMVSAVGPDEIIHVPNVGGREPRKLPKRVIADIIETRLEEIFSFAFREIDNSGYRDKIPSGIVLTGGAAIMDAAPELCGRVTGLPVRRGIPIGVGGMSDLVRLPKSATAVGLLLQATRHADLRLFKPKESKGVSLRERLVSWLKEII